MSIEEFRSLKTNDKVRDVCYGIGIVVEHSSNSLNPWVEVQFEKDAPDKSLYPHTKCLYAYMAPGLERVASSHTV